MKVSELPERPKYKQYLYCYLCNGQYSAHRGDYFHWPPTAVMECCEKPLQLVQERITRRLVQRAGQR
jgi:hypothetical protein